MFLLSYHVDKDILYMLLKDDSLASCLPFKRYGKGLVCVDSSCIPRELCHWMQRKPLDTDIDIQPIRKACPI